MLTVLIGHRGVGKSELLKRIRAYFEEDQQAVACIDLDSEIERATGRSIPEIFDSEGESSFRRLEKENFERILSSLDPSQQTFLSLGAGFDVSHIPAGIRVLWIRRKTDLLGRIFLDRPALEKGLSPLEEFKKRAAERETRFEEVFTEELTLPEGLFAPDPFEKKFFLNQLEQAGGVLTLLPENFRSQKEWEFFINRRLKWGFDFFEVRDDLLTPAMVDQVFDSVPLSQIIYSFRKKEALLPDPDKLSRVGLWDWPLELGSCPFGSPSIVSLHERLANESLEAAIVRLESASPKGAYMKLASFAHNFSELELGYRWMMSQAPQACFVPRSANGRWAWFRLLMKGRFPINFMREGMGSAIDQPHLLEWLRTPEKAAAFSAVLGYPVIHSHTPMEHDNFFRAQGKPVLAIPLGEPEWEEAIPFLEELGLREAAVTSPLKKKAFEFAEAHTSEAETFRAVNTLAFDSEEKKWRGHSTDIYGLEALLSEVKTNNSSVVVWGGGGVLSQIAERLPQAQFYSARTGRPREGSKEMDSPSVVIWAAPRASEYKWPDPRWKPDQVIDLNYREDSTGREYALRSAAAYVSGYKMFQVQAEAQREFWS